MYSAVEQFASATLMLLGFTLNGTVKSSPPVLLEVRQVGSYLLWINILPRGRNVLELLSQSKFCEAGKFGGKGDGRGES